jgi:hypothetical protein
MSTLETKKDSTNIFAGIAINWTMNPKDPLNISAVLGGSTSTNGTNLRGNLT